MFCISGICVQEVLCMDGGVSLPYRVIYWATGHCLFSYILHDLFIVLWCFISLLLIWLFLAHNLPRSIIWKKGRLFIRVWKPPFVSVPLLFSAALSVFLLSIFSLYCSHPIYLIFTQVIQHWVILSCAFSICPCVGSFFLANLLSYINPSHFTSLGHRENWKCVIAFLRLTFAYIRKHTQKTDFVGILQHLKY